MGYKKEVEKEMEQISGQIFVDRCQYCEQEFQGLTEKDAKRKTRSHEAFCKKNPSIDENGNK